jgi:hypothetical protein
VIKSAGFVAVLLLAACGGSAGSAPTEPARSASGTVEGFMQAVADSNLAKMAMLWGTSRGPAAQTNTPPDWERRIAIMRSYLRNEAFRIESDAPDGEARHLVQVELRRETCTWVVPFTVIKLGDGTWIVNQVDLTTAGNPMRPCQEATQEDSTAH